MKPGWLLVGAAAVLLLTPVFLHLPGNDLLTVAVQNSGHSVLFLVASVLSFPLVQRAFPTSMLRQAIVLLGGLFVAGLAVELAQHLTGRGASFRDLGMNLLGLMAGWCLIRALQAAACAFSKGVLPLGSGLHMIMWLALSGAALLWAWREPLQLLRLRLTQPPLPMLADFERSGSEKRWRTHLALVERVRAPQHWLENTSMALSITLLPGAWPSARMMELPPDWSNYNHLLLDVFNPSDPMRISLYLYTDATDDPGHQRQIQTVELPTGNTQLQLPLDRWLQPGLDLGDQRDSAQVWSVLLYIPRTNRSVQFLVDNFALQ